MTVHSNLMYRFLQNVGLKRVPASEFVIGKFRATGEPCTLAQTRDLEKDVGYKLLDHIDCFDGEELKASLALYLDGKTYETCH